MVLASTHVRTLEVVPLDILRAYAVDVPDDPGRWTPDAARGRAQSRGGVTSVATAMRFHELIAAMAITRFPSSAFEN